MHFFGDNQDLKNIIIPDSVKTIGDYTFLNKYLENIEVIPNNSYYSSEDGALLNKNKTILYRWPTAGKSGNIIIPDGVLHIAGNAFYSYGGASIVIPKSMTIVDEYAFNTCSSLKTVFYKGSEKDWGKISLNGQYNALKSTNIEIVYNVSEKTYQFVTNCNETLPDITYAALMSAPKITNGEKTLMGWYDNASFNGVPITFPYYGDSTTLYAEWTDKTGSSFDDALVIKANMELTVDIDHATTTTTSQYIYYVFVPKVTGEYKFHLDTSASISGYIYNANKELLTTFGNQATAYTMTAGKTYYITAGKNGWWLGHCTLVTEADFVESPTVCVTMEDGEKKFISLPDYLPKNLQVIFTCYKGDRLVNAQTGLTNPQTLFFTVPDECDSSRIMLWENFKALIPYCEAENVPLN